MEDTVIAQLNLNGNPCTPAVNPNILGEEDILLIEEGTLLNRPAEHQWRVVSIDLDAEEVLLRLHHEEIVDGIDDDPLYGTYLDEREEWRSTRTLLTDISNQLITLIRI